MTLSRIISHSAIVFALIVVAVSSSFGASSQGGGAAPNTNSTVIGCPGSYYCGLPMCGVSPFTGIDYGDCPPGGGRCVPYSGGQGNVCCSADQCDPCPPCDGNTVRLPQGSESGCGQCCPLAQVCRGQCCEPGQTCSSDGTCGCPQGTTTCGSTCCGPGQTCENGSVCRCPADKTLCGTSCCNAGDLCQNGECVCPNGQPPCNGTCCGASQICTDGRCGCPGGGPLCNDTCCGESEICSNNRCCPADQPNCGGGCPTGSCDSTCCAPPGRCEVGSDGLPTCACPNGASQCGDRCCNENESCVDGSCQPSMGRDVYIRG